MEGREREREKGLLPLISALELSQVVDSASIFKMCDRYFCAKIMENREKRAFVKIKK